MTEHHIFYEKSETKHDRKEATKNIVSRQGLYKYLISKDKSCKYEPPANAILDYRPFCGKIEKTFMRICVAHANEWG